MRSSRGRAIAALLSVSAVCAGLAVTTLDAAAASSAFGNGTPGFVNSSPPAGIDAGLLANRDFAGEPSIGINWNTGSMLFMASNSTYKAVTSGNPDAPTFTWSDVSSPFSQFNLDPILATHSATGLTMAGGDDGACAVMSATRDDGGTWVPTLPCPIAADHPTVGIGPFHAPAPVDAVGADAAYFCQQPILNAAPDECSYSHDGGLSWKPSVPDTSASACKSLFGHVKIGPDGTAYIPDNSCKDASGNSVVGGLRTTDNGQTLTSYGIPGATTPPDGFDPSVAVDGGNRLYESWSAQQPDGTYHPVISWSDDQGATWASPVDLAGTVPGGFTAATFNAVVAGDAATLNGAPTGSGRAAVAYLAAQDGQAGADPFTAGFVGHWNLYISYTYDSGATWQTVQATTDPVQIGEIDAGGTTTGGQRNLLDFMDASLTKDGRVVVAYADGCLVGCTNVATSQDELATIAYQTTGEGLFAANDTAAPVTAPAAPTLTATSAANDGTVQLNWTAPNDGGAAITQYDVSRATGTGTLTHLATVSSGQSYSDSDVTLGTTYRYTVSATNAAGTGSASNEASATPTTPPGASTLTATAGKGQVKLSWTQPSDGGNSITGYAIYRGTSSGAETLLQTVSSGTSYIDGSVTGGTTYYYEVAASNADGTGARSNEASAVPKKGGR